MKQTTLEKIIIGLFFAVSSVILFGALYIFVESIFLP